MIPDHTPSEPDEEDGLIFGCLLDGNGGARLIDWSFVETWQETDGPLWVHLDRNSPRVASWLKDRSGLTGPTVDALLAEETRPRVFRGKKGVVSILRGINTNPDASPEDMVDLRMWSDGKKVITLRRRRLMSARDVLAQLIDFRNGPVDSATLYERLIARLTERMSGRVASYEDKLDELEEDIDIDDAATIRRDLSDLRQNTVLLRRYISPQREALHNLLTEPPQWFDDACRIGLRETTDRLLRYIEELDAARERAIVIKDDIANQLAESTNQTLYILAIISAIFLPLGFLTGLMGINIGGMPGVESPHAFWLFTGGMIGVIALELVIFKRLKWL